MSKEKAQKPIKTFSWDNYHERQIALRVAYIGWSYHGFIASEPHETIEHFLFKALLQAKLIKSRQECYYSLCGRTDTGVSGIGNVISVRVRSVCPQGIGVIPKEGAPVRPEELNYVEILNGLLPETIRITSMAYVPIDFNARFSCISRSYRYFFPKFNRDIKLMEEAASYLIGEHDFRNFCKYSPEQTKHCIRKINSITFGDAGNDIWYFEICATGFIWHQIRCTATVLFLVGDHKEKPTITLDLLDIEKYPGRPQYPIADPQPLVFWMANYDGLDWFIQTNLEQRFKNNFGKQLLDLNIRTAVLRCFCDGNIPEPPQGSYKPISKLPMVESVEQLWAKYEETQNKE